MSNRIRQGLAFVIAIGMLITVAAVPTAAQDATTDDFEIAAANADTVDGKHAVGYTTKRGKRAGKLVATNSNGFLPSNILKPQWRVIQNKPAGLMTGVQITTKTVNLTVDPGTSDYAIAVCPAGGKVVGGGFTQDAASAIVVTDSGPDAVDAWVVWGTNPDVEPRGLSAYALCMTTTPTASLSSKGGVQIASTKNKKKTR